jgi:hypothetical protein
MRVPMVPTERLPPTIHALPALDSAHRSVLDATGTLADEQNAAVLATRVADLRRIVTRHFTDEEGPGGLFERLMARHPASEAEIADLKEEHRQIRIAVDALAEAVDDEGPEGPRVERLRADVVARIRRHEDREMRLLTDVTNLELGGPGGG